MLIRAAEMHIVQKQIPRWSTKWCLLQTLSGFCLLISVAAMIGSIAGVYLVCCLPCSRRFVAIAMRSAMYGD